MFKFDHEHQEVTLLAGNSGPIQQKVLLVPNMSIDNN